MRSGRSSLMLPTSSRQSPMSELPQRSTYLPLICLISRVRSLSIILEDVKIASPQRDLNDEQHKDLYSITEGCHNVLKTLNETLEGYQELDPNPKDYDSKSFRFKVRRGWKRLRWEPDDIKELRSRITSNVSLLSAFNGRLTRYPSSIC